MHHQQRQWAIIMNNKQEFQQNKFNARTIQTTTQPVHDALQPTDGSLLTVYHSFKKPDEIDLFFKLSVVTAGHRHDLSCFGAFKSMNRLKF